MTLAPLVPILTPILTPLAPILAVFTAIVTPVFTSFLASLVPIAVPFAVLFVAIPTAVVIIVGLRGRQPPSQRDDEQPDAGSDLHGDEPPTWHCPGFDARKTQNLQ